MMPSKLDAAAALESMDSMDALQSKPLTMIPDEIRPAFDYSGLDEQTVDDLHFAEKEYQHGKKLAERGLVHMGNAIAAAHDALCGVVQQLDTGSDGACRNLRRAHNNQHCDDTFRAWCVSIGITKDTAYRLLQVAALMDNSSPRQQRVLKELSPSLLYAVAKPSAPAELVAQVKSGDITTHKQYQEALAQIKAKDKAIAAEKERADAAEAQLEAAHADISGLKDRATAAEAREEEAWNMVSKAQDEAKAAQENLDYEVSQNDALHEEKGQLLRECEAAKQARAEAEARAKDAENQLAGSRQVAEAAKLRGDKLKAENDALKHQPITAVVDKDEVQRQAEALSRKDVQEARQQAAEAQARLWQYQEDAEGLLAPAQACAQQAQFIADSVRAMYLNWFGSAVAADASLAQMGTPLYAVCGEIMSSLEEENTINPTAAGSEEDAEREALFE